MFILLIYIHVNLIEGKSVNLKETNLHSHSIFKIKRYQITTKYFSYKCLSVRPTVCLFVYIVKIQNIKYQSIVNLRMQMLLNFCIYLHTQIDCNQSLLSNKHLSFSFFFFLTKNIC